MLETTIYFVRHASSERGSKREERTRGLTDIGFSDAKRVARVLKEEGVNVLISSPYRRAIQTLEDASRERGINIETNEDFRERAMSGPDYIFGEHLFPAIKKVFQETTYTFPGGESNVEAKQRGMRGMTDVLTRYAGKKVAIGIHGNIMTIILNAYDSFYDYDFWLNTSKPDIYKLNFQGERMISVTRLWEVG
ncbi:histidine phosphatase family protein [Bacillus sp. FSL W7-1360]